MGWCSICKVDTSIDRQLTDRYGPMDPKVKSATTLLKLSLDTAGSVNTYMIRSIQLSIVYGQRRYRAHALHFSQLGESTRHISGRLRVSNEANMMESVVTIKESQELAYSTITLIIKRRPGKQNQKPVKKYMIFLYGCQSYSFLIFKPIILSNLVCDILLTTQKSVVFLLGNVGNFFIYSKDQTLPRRSNAIASPVRRVQRSEGMFFSFSLSGWNWYAYKIYFGLLVAI